MAEDTIQPLDTDVDGQRLGAMYAKALLGVSEKSGVSDQIVEELSDLVELFSQVNGLESLLASPRISSSEKLGMVDRVFGGRMSDELLTFLKVVCQHDRLDCLRHISRAASQELNRLRGRLEVYVTTSEPISDEVANRIEETLRTSLGTEIMLTTRVDESLIGGLLVKVGDTVYDGSIVNQLSRLRQETINSTARQIREVSDRFATSG